MFLRQLRVAVHAGRRILNQGVRIVTAAVGDGVGQNVAYREGELISVRPVILLKSEEEGIF
jgi:hypothetical protein